jgi:hypothetical protein
MHPFTLSCAINLANCLGDAGELAAAESLGRETISRLASVLHQDHPDVLVCQADLAITLRDAGRKEEAEELRATVLAGFDRVLGAAHPDAVQARSGQRINRDLEQPAI